MPLPGKLIIGFLEEDNPVKAFFRIRPMWAQDGEKGYFLNDMDQKYLEDGFIRIVPDKNELAVFKGRMRSLGRYCALDLRNFPGENEKIRPNKNYGMGAERNAFIVYSDVIGPVAQKTAMEVLDGQYVFVSEEVTLRCAAPGTKYVLLKREGQLLGPWIWSEAQDVAGCITLRHAPGIPMRMVAEEEAREHLFLMELDNVQVWLMTCPGLFDVTDAAGQEQPREAEKPSVPEQPAPRAEAARPFR